MSFVSPYLPRRLEHLHIRNMARASPEPLLDLLLERTHIDNPFTLGYEECPILEVLKTMWAIYRTSAVWHAYMKDRLEIYALIVTLWELQMMEAPMWIRMDDFVQF